MSPTVNSTLINLARDTTITTVARSAGKDEPQRSWASRNVPSIVFIAIIGTLVVGCIVGFAMAKYNKRKTKRDWKDAEQQDVALRTARNSGVKENDRAAFGVAARDSGLSEV